MARTTANVTQAARRLRLSQELRATYDAAQSTDDNRKTWAAADGLSAEAANSLAVRIALRKRARYEAANNSSLDGVLDTLADDVVGTGPILQMLLPTEAGGDKANTVIEGEFAEWMDDVGLAEKLHTLVRSSCESGESFTVFETNPVLGSPVKLNPRLVECDQFSDPTWQSAMSPYWCDGIQYDVFGNPVSYRMLKMHPGSLGVANVLPTDYVDIPARYVYHLFRAKRPGQRRGVPEYTSALSNWPELRRYCNAVLAAAETAAEFAAVFKTERPEGDYDAPQEEGDTAPGVLDTFDLPKRGAAMLPSGVEPFQLKAEQPTTTYPQFVDKKLAEACRCLAMPLTIAALDSSNANLSARYMDGQIYGKTIKRRRKHLSRLLDRMFDLWLTEALLIPGYLPEAATSATKYPHKWYWPKVMEHADAEKVESARAQRLKSGASSLADECAEDGADWEDVQAKAARSLGLTIEEYQRLVRIGLWGQADAPVPAKPTEDGGAAPAPLNGAQIEGALSVLSKMREGALSSDAATQLLVGLGFAQADADRIASGVTALDSGAGDVAFKREVLKQLLSVPAAREAVYNAMDIEDLVGATGLPPEAGYLAPYIPVVAPAGPLVSGAELKDPAGDTVGGDVLPAADETPDPQAQQQGAQQNDRDDPEDVDEKDTDGESDAGLPVNGADRGAALAAAVADLPPGKFARVLQAMARAMGLRRD